MGTVDVRSTPADAGRQVGFSGLQSCGSVWACPVCSAKIQAQRREELKKLVVWAALLGYGVAFGTVTLRHRKGQSLADLWAAVSKGYTSVHNSARVQRLRKAMGVVGFVRAFEVTYGGNGWHPHLHMLWIFKHSPEDERPGLSDAGISPSDWEKREVTISQERYQKRLDELRDAEFSIWEKQAVKRGLGAPLKDNYQLRLVVDATDIGDYLTKEVFDPGVGRKSSSMAYEMSGSATKRGRAVTSRTPWQILEDVIESGDADDLALWTEYELTSKGKPALVWSKGLKKLLELDEKSDDEIAEEEIGSEEDVLFSLGDWEHARYYGAGILNAVEEGGLEGGLEYCRQHGIWTLDADDPDVVEDRMLYATRHERAEDVD